MCLIDGIYFFSVGLNSKIKKKGLQELTPLLLHLLCINFRHKLELIAFAGTTLTFGRISAVFFFHFWIGHRLHRRLLILVSTLHTQSF